MNKHCRRVSPHSVTATKLFALMLVICLAECVTGSCLSYGHSCWGAHGKRSGQPPASAPDWYLTRILRRLAANAELNRGKHPASNDEIGAIYHVDMEDNTPVTDRLIGANDASLVKLPLSRDPEARPMLDDDVISKMKLWQITREAPEDN